MRKLCKLFVFAVLICSLVSLGDITVHAAAKTSLKNGWHLVRVPSNRIELTIEDGCRYICGSAFTYLADSFNGVLLDTIVCDRLKTLNIPSSVESIQMNTYPGMKDLNGYGASFTYLENINGATVLDGMSLSDLLLMVTSGDTVRSLIDDARAKGVLTESEDGKMTFYKDDHLLIINPDENEEEIIIPDGIKTIGALALGMQQIYSGTEKNVHIGTLKVGKDVEKVGTSAFKYYVFRVNKSVDLITIDSLVLNNKLKDVF